MLVNGVCPGLSASERAGRELYHDAPPGSAARACVAASSLCSAGRPFVRLGSRPLVRPELRQSTPVAAASEGEWIFFLVAGDRTGGARVDGYTAEIATDQIRLLTKVARMYHERGMRQPQIAQQLHISQPRVSRLLKRAVELGIVRTTVIA